MPRSATNNFGMHGPWSVWWNGADLHCSRPASQASLLAMIALKLHALKHGHPERFEKDFGDVISLTRNAGLDPRSDSYRQLFDRFGTVELYERILQRVSGA